ASHAADIAASVQAVLERSMLHLAQSVKQATGARHLCLAGGVALNSVCNGKIAQSAWFDDVFVQPAAADNGQAIGLAYHAHLESSASAPIQPIASAYGGRSYHDAEIDDALQAHDLASVRFDQAAALVQHVATLLADGKVVGWFQGGSEYGPRALGHRSILADPRSAEMKDHLNQHIKFREPFRPFAPSVLATHAHEVFALPCDSPYMLVVAPVRQAWRDRVPAITHVDGTARVQTVSPSVSPRYHALLEAFRVRTGIPLLLNTSFNLRGMPVVEHPADALRCFLLSGLDALVLGDNVVVQPSFEHVCFRVAPGWALEAGQRRLRHGVQLWPRFVSQAHDEAHRVDIDQVLLRTLMACDGQRFFTQALPFAAGDTPSLSAAQRTAMYGQCVAFCRRGWLELRVGHGRWMGQER
ncbi:MAG: carbamoyltransferase C-terminal domain-containing protein, partial [Polyangiales bacterium]